MHAQPYAPSGLLPTAKLVLLLLVRDLSMHIQHKIKSADSLQSDGPLGSVLNGEGASVGCALNAAC